MVAAYHAREFRFRHVAIDAGRLVLRMVAVSRPVAHLGFVAGQARLVGRGWLAKTVASA